MVFSSILTQTALVANPPAAVEYSEIPSYVKNALIIVDMQNCFLDSCTPNKFKADIPISGSGSIVAKINALREWELNYRNSQDKNFFTLTLFSHDVHSKNHTSFASAHVNATNKVNGNPEYEAYGTIPVVCNIKGTSMDPFTYDTGGEENGYPSGSLPKCCINPPDTVENGEDEELCGCKETIEKTHLESADSLCRMMTMPLDPDHCVNGTRGVKLSPYLIRRDEDIDIEKGTNEDVSTSGIFFEDFARVDDQINFAQGYGIDSYTMPTYKILKKHNITDLYFTGVSTEFTIKYSAMQASMLGFKVWLIKDLMRGLWHGVPLDQIEMREKKIFKAMDDVPLVRVTTLKNLTEKYSNKLVDVNETLCGAGEGNDDTVGSFLATMGGGACPSHGFSLLSLTAVLLYIVVL